MSRIKAAAIFVPTNAISGQFRTLTERTKTDLSNLIVDSRHRRINRSDLNSIVGLDQFRRQLLSQLLFQPPIVQEHEGILVVRDDLIPGGTKSRFFVHLFADHDEIVYASTTWGGAQIALAHSARLMDKRATIFVAKRNELHPRTLEAKNIGKDHVKIIQVPMGFLNVLQSHAKRYCESHKDVYYLEVGGKEPLVMELLAKVAKKVEDEHGPFDEVWSSAGSGTLALGLQNGITNKRTKFYIVQVGMDIKDVGRAEVIPYPKKLQQELRIDTPFPSCPNFDRKAWELCKENHGTGKILFWNVLGPSPTIYS